MFKYWKGICKQAVKEAWWFVFDHPGRFMIGAFATSIGIFGVRLLGSAEGWIDAAIQALWGLVVIFIAFVGLVIWKVLTIPARLDAEKDAALLKGKVDELREVKLEPLFDPSKEPYYTPNHAPHQLSYGWSFAIYNSGNKTSENVTIALEGVEPRPKNEKIPFVTPLEPDKLSGGNPYECRINPKSQALFRICLATKEKAYPDACWSIIRLGSQGPISPWFSLNPEERLELIYIVSMADSKPWPLRFVLYQEGDNIKVERIL
jgi:hypothetical protein